MRTALAPNRRALKLKAGRQTTRDDTYFAPVGGWNTRDSLAAMPPTDAAELINWFPRQKAVVARGGYVEHSDTTVDEDVETLLSYQYGATSKLFAVCNNEIYDGDTPGSSLQTVTNSVISSAMMGGVMMCCNGADAPFKYNGSTFVAHGLTDASATLSFPDLIYVFAFKGRLYFVEKNTQSFWYGGVGASAGAILEFDLSLTGSFKGSLMYITAITDDGGSGKDDLFVAVFSEGDVAVYSGSNPSDASDWNRVGTYKIGKPLGRYAHVANGKEIIAATERGYESIVRSFQSGEGVRTRDLYSEKIQSAVTDLVKLASAIDNWRMVLYNRGQMLIVQAPQTALTFHHHVRNINTGAWTRFDLPAAYCWVMHNGRLYMGGRGDGKVYLFDSGDTDAGTAIRLTAETAWNPMKRLNRNKQLHWMRFNFFGIYFPSISVAVHIDFNYSTTYTTTSPGSQASPPIWDLAIWDQAVWSKGIVVRNYDHFRGAFGKYFSVRIICDGHQGPLSWNTTTYFVEDAGII